MNRPLLAFGFGFSFLVGACVGGKSLSKEELDRLRPYILDSAPDVAHPKDINFDDKIHLVGYKVEPEVAAPGTEVKLTYYWRVDEAPGDGWSLFTHLQPEGGGRTDNLDTVGPLRESRDKKQVMGPARWEKGKFYVDEQTYKVPAEATGVITVYTGLWKESGNVRMPIKSGPNDGDNRGEVVRLKTNGTPGAKPPTPSDVPELRASKLAKGEVIVIDGKSDDKAWATAATTGAFGDVMRGGPNTSFPVNGSAKVVWDETNLYVLFEVRDPDVVGIGGDPKSKPSDYTATGQPKLWTRDTVEIMIDPDGDGDNRDYYELQINPQNKLFHSQFDGYNSPKGNGPGESGPFGHEEWDPKLKSAVVVRGTIDNEKERDEGYVVEIAIPWVAFAKGAKAVPPRDGDAWRLNFYAMEANSGVSWSPIMGRGNFHFAPRFGRVFWVDPNAPRDAGRDTGSDASKDAASDGSSGLSDTGAEVSDGAPPPHSLRMFLGDSGLRPRPFLNRRRVPIPEQR